MITVPTLLPNNASPLELAVEQVSARATDLPTPLATLYNADTCPAHLLGWLAWAVSVDEWDNAWPESVKRDTIKRAPLLHQRKGTMWAVREALAPLASDTRVTEWWQATPVATPGTMVVTTYLGATTADAPIITPERTAQVERIVNATKPVSRSHNLRVALGATTPHDSAGVLRAACVLRAQARVATAHLVNVAHDLGGALRPAARSTFVLDAT